MFILWILSVDEAAKYEERWLLLVKPVPKGRNDALL